jgi:uncharacterized membrane protein YhaH (DUF805 family)
MKYYIDVLKKYADFNGRARRKEFWMFTLFHIIIIYGLLGIGIAIQAEWMVYIMLFYILATIIPTLAVQFRRVQDIGKNGWYSLIPYYNLYLFCQDSERGINEYGTSAKYGGDEISEIGKIQE